MILCRAKCWRGKYNLLGNRSLFLCIYITSCHQQSVLSGHFRCRILRLKAISCEAEVTNGANRKYLTLEQIIDP